MIKAQLNTVLPLMPNGQLDKLEDFKMLQQVRIRIATEVMKIKVKAV